MTLHSLCLAPVKGSCADRQSDPQWNDGVANMQQSMDEAIQRIQATVSSLNDFVPKIVADHTEIDEIVKANNDNQEIANKILAFFTARQPEFFFQVLVYPPSDRSNYWRRSAVEPFATELQVTGHFHFENIEGRGISIRYRSRSLSPPSTTVTISGQTSNFPEFHQMTIKRVGTVGESNAAVTDVDGGCTGLESGHSGGALACTVPHCFACSPDEQAAYDSLVGFFFIGRVEGFDVKEATDNVDSFPRYDAVFELNYSFATEFFPGTATTRDVFRFHFFLSSIGLHFLLV